MRNLNVLIIVFLLLNTASYASEITRSRIIMGTLVKISVVDDGIGEDNANKAIDRAFGSVEGIDRLMSNYKEDSEISRLNRIKGNEPLVVNPQVFEIVQKSIEFGKLTSGAFDITVGPLLKLWGFYSSDARSVPDDDKIREIMSMVGYKNIRLFPSERKISFAKDDVKIDLGGIAKGYAVDKAVESLRGSGVKSALICASGDIFALGSGSLPNMWRVGIQHPRKEDEIWVTLVLKDKAVSTSGDYNKYFVSGGKRYSHIIDPRTGYPKSDIPASVTIIACDATAADALATGIFVMGAEKGLEVIESIPGVECMIVSDIKGKLTMSKSKGFDKYVDLAAVEKE
ncbi:MAG: FAD:protein FMN transferase [Candidatus Omnitrophica bacterium]|nr:FAD:protein FMN transferase [Candidatus Omnitrophota bacterium]